MHFARNGSGRLPWGRRSRPRRNVCGVGGCRTPKPLRGSTRHAVKIARRARHFGPYYPSAPEVERGPKLVEYGPNLSDIKPKSADFIPALVEVRPLLWMSAQVWSATASKSALIWTNAGHIWPNTAAVWSKAAKLGRDRPILVDHTCRFAHPSDGSQRRPSSRRFSTRD